VNKLSMAWPAAELWRTRDELSGLRDFTFCQLRRIAAEMRQWKAVGARSIAAECQSFKKN